MKERNSRSMLLFSTSRGANISLQLRGYIAILAVFYFNYLRQCLMIISCIFSRTSIAFIVVEAHAALIAALLQTNVKDGKFSFWFSCVTRRSA